MLRHKGDITSYGHPWQLNMYRRIWETRDKEDQNMNIKMGVAGLQSLQMFFLRHGLSQHGPTTCAGFNGPLHFGRLKKFT